MKTQINHSSGISTFSEITFPILLFLCGFIYFCLQILGFDLKYIPGDLGDSRFINFLLEHGHKWIIGDESSFWSAEFMYPFKNAIALSDNMIGALPLYSLWRFLGFEMETAYQLWWLTVCTLNYWICYLILRKWDQNAFVAAVLSWIFAFSIFNIGQLNYMQMIVRFMIPVAFYAAIKMINTPSRKYFLLYLFAIVFQLYLVMYTGIYLFYFSLLFIVIYCLIDKKFSNLLFYFKKEQLGYNSIILVAFLFLMGMLLLPYHQMSKTVGLRLYREVVPNLPQAKSYLLPHGSSILWNFLSEKMKLGINEYWLHYLFPGIILFLTLIVSPLYLLYAYYRNISIRPEIKAVISCSFLIALLHLNFGKGISFYAAIFKLPGINSIRVPIRFMHVELFLLVLTLGYFIKNFKPIFILLFFLFVFTDNMFNPEIIPRNNKKELIERRNKLYNEIIATNNNSEKIIAVIDTVEPAFATNLDAMIVSQSLGLKTINGYSSYCDDDFDEFFNKSSYKGLNKWLKASNLSPKKVIVIDRNKN